MYWLTSTTASQVERTSLGKATPEVVKRVAASDTPTNQDALLANPEVMLAQSNAFNITVHRLVRENLELKKANAELLKKSISVEQESDGHRRSAVNLTNEKSALKARIADLETENKILKREAAEAKDEASVSEVKADRLVQKMKSIEGLAKDV